MKRSKVTVVYWIFTALFCLQMGFTAFAQLTMPDVMKEFTRLGFPDYFRIQLCCMKLAGVLVVLLPMAPARLKEWAYAGFAFTLGSALIAHLSCGDGVEKWIWSVGTFVLGAASYYGFRARESVPA